MTDWNVLIIGCLWIAAWLSFIWLLIELKAVWDGTYYRRRHGKSGRGLLSWLSTFIAIVLVIGLAGCEKERNEKPGATDEEDLIFNEQTVKPPAVDEDEGLEWVEVEEESARSAARGVLIGTYTPFWTDDFGRKSWRIPGPMNKFGSRCLVVFSDGRAYRVVSRKACRTMPRHFGFVWKPGSHGGPWINSKRGTSPSWVKIYRG